jgi:hypothetical protein
MELDDDTGPMETFLNQDLKVFMELDDDTGPMDGCYIQADAVGNYYVLRTT